MRRSRRSHARAYRSGLSRLVLTIVLAMGATSALAPDSEATLGRRELARKMDELFAPWDRDDSPGAAVLVTHRGKTMFQQGYGLANLEDRVPITPSTRFDLASASKQFTAMAILLLEQEGRINLEDDIRLHLPELPDLGQPITIDNLLHHTSGLWDYWQIVQFTGFERSDYLDLEQMMTLMEHQEDLVFEPGAKWSYCNSNYALLAEIVARLTGDSFDEWTRANIFGPLRMGDTKFWSDCFEVIPGCARPYQEDAGGFRSGRQADITFAGQGHAFSTLKDMAKWLDNFRTAELGGREFIDRMFTKGVLNDGSEIFYAAGLGVLDHRGIKTVGHSGQTGGFKSQVLYCPDLEVGVVVLANVSSVGTEGLANRILDIYLTDELGPLPEAEAKAEEPFIELAPEILDRYEGSFQLEGAPVVVATFREGDNLLAAMSGEGMAFIYPVSETRFMVGHRRVSVEFLPEADGDVNRVRIDLEGDEMWADRMEDTLTIEEARQYVGKYYSEALGMVYAIDLKDGELSLSHRRAGEFTTRMLFAGEDTFASGFGFLEFYREPDGKLAGFRLSHEFLGDGRLTFEAQGD